MELKKNQEIRDGVLYDKNTNKKIGNVDFEKTQVDTLTFMPLSKKVIGILTGNYEFKSDDSLDEDYDEPEEEEWREDLNEEDYEKEPFDEYSDKVDLVDTQKELINKSVEVTKVIEAANNQKEAKLNVEKKSENEVTKDSIKTDE